MKVHLVGPDSTLVLSYKGTLRVECNSLGDNALGIYRSDENVIVVLPETWRVYFSSRVEVLG